MRFILLASLLIATAASAQGDPSVRYVFFDWGKNELTNDAKSALDTIATDYAAAPRALLIDGHSDRSGSTGGNMVRSRSRAILVEDYLAMKGVPVSQMTVRAYGESRLLIATDDGVREVQNRRVEIRFR